MSVHRHSRPRSRRRSLQLEFAREPFDIWIPTIDDPLVIASFGDAASLAIELLDWNVEREVLVLLDEQRRVTAMLLDPPPPVGVLVGSCDLPALEVPFCNTMSIVVDAAVVDGPPSEDDRAGYFGLRRMHMLQGLLLLDVILADHERVQSLAIALDPDPIWFEPFDPFEPFGGFGQCDEPAA